jgi:hypothetical protein
MDAAGAIGETIACLVGRHYEIDIIDKGEWCIQGWCGA